MCDYHSSVLHLGTSKIYHIPSNSHSEIVEYYQIPENTNRKTVFVELEWNCIGEFALEKVVSLRNEFKIENLSNKNIRAIERYYKGLKSLHQNPISPKSGDIFYSWEFVDVWMKLNLPGLGEMISETMEDGVYPFDLDLRGYYHPFNAPSLERIDGRLYLSGYSHPFNAPLLKEIGEFLDLWNYSHPFNAPSLEKVRGFLDLEGYSHPFNASLLKEIGGYIILRGYSHPFNAPLLKEMSGGLNLRGYSRPFNAPLLKEVGRNIYLEGYSHPFNAPSLERVEGSLFLKRYPYAKELREQLRKLNC